MPISGDRRAVCPPKYCAEANNWTGHRADVYAPALSLAGARWGRGRLQWCRGDQLFECLPIRIEEALHARASCCIGLGRPHSCGDVVKMVPRILQAAVAQESARDMWSTGRAAGQ